MSGTDASSGQMLAAASIVLAQGESLNRLSRLVTVMGLVGLAVLGLVAGHAVRPAMLLLAATVLAGLIELWFAMRAAVDAALFHRLSLAPDWAALDMALTQLRLMPAAKAGRPMEARIAGSMRLLRYQGAALIAQVGFIAAGAVLGAW